MMLFLCHSCVWVWAVSQEDSVKDTNPHVLPAPELEAGETFLVYDHIVVICFLHFPGFQCHYTIDRSVVRGSYIGLTHAAFVL